MADPATDPFQASTARSWTPLTAIAAGVAPLAVLILLLLLLTPLTTRPVPVLSAFQMEQLAALLAVAGAAAMLAVSTAQLTGKRGIANLAESAGWNSGRRALAKSAASGAVVGAIIHFLLVAIRGAAGYLSVGDFICVVLAGVLAEPLLEEFYFRGILLPTLAKKLGPIASLVIVTLLSSLLHLGQTLYVIPAMALFGIIQLRTKSVENCCAAHAAYNLCLALLILH